jgi:hypothetical protein
VGVKYVPLATSSRTQILAGCPLVRYSAFAGARRQVLEAHVAAVNQTDNRALSAARAPVEPGIARLKSWRIFRKAWCSPNCMSSITTTILTLERHR